MPSMIPNVLSGLSISVVVIISTIKTGCIPMDGYDFCVLLDTIEGPEVVVLVREFNQIKKKLDFFFPYKQKKSL